MSDVKVAACLALMLALSGCQDKNSVSGTQGPAQVFPGIAGVWYTQ